MVTAALSISGWGLLILAVVILIVALVAFFMSIDSDSGPGIVIGFVVAILALGAMVIGGVGIGERAGEANKTLPDFSKQCRGGIELSVLKTDRRQDDVQQVEEAIEDDLGCTDAVEEIIQVPFRSPYVEASALEPPAVELVPQGVSGFPGGISPNGGTTAPAGP